MGVMTNNRTEAQQYRLGFRVRVCMTVRVRVSVSVSFRHY